MQGGGWVVGVKIVIFFSDTKIGTTDGNPLANKGSVWVEGRSESRSSCRLDFPLGENENEEKLAIWR